MNEKWRVVRFSDLVRALVRQVCKGCHFVLRSTNIDFDQVVRVLVVTRGVARSRSYEKAGALRNGTVRNLGMMQVAPMKHIYDWKKATLTTKAIPFL